MIFDRLFEEFLLHRLQPLGILRGDIVREAEVAARVEQFPHVLVERRARFRRPRLEMDRARQPAVLIQRAVTEYLEILLGAAIGRLRIGEAVFHADPVDRHLLDPVDADWGGQPGGFEHGRRDIDDVMKLRPQPRRAEMARPRHYQPVARAAEIGRHLLGPTERRVARERPARSVMIVGHRPAELVDHLQLVCHRFGDAVEIGVLVGAAVRAALGARTIVADDIEDQRVVEAAELLERVDQPPCLVVGHFGEAGEHLHLSREQPFLVGRQRVPRADILRTRRELRALGHHAHRDLPLERLLAHRVPAGVELAAIAVAPFGRDMVRRMGRAGRVIEEERLVWRQRGDRAQPGDRLIGHVGQEMIAGCARRLDMRGAVIDGRRPLVGLAGDEAVEFVEARPRRPAIERADRADVGCRGLVPFAERASGIAVEAQHLGDRRGAGRLPPGVTGEHRGAFHDRAGLDIVMVAPGQQRGARWGAERGSVEIIVAVALRGELFERRHVDRAAERARLAEAHVVDQDHHDVWCPRRRSHRRYRRRRDGVAYVERGQMRPLRLGDRQHGAIDFLWRGRRRALRQGARRQQCGDCGDQSRPASDRCHPRSPSRSQRHYPPLYIGRWL